MYLSFGDGERVRTPWIPPFTETKVSYSDIISSVGRVLSGEDRGRGIEAHMMSTKLLPGWSERLGAILTR